ncbi:MAG: sulfatase [Chitinophagaceae bacterium]
MKYAPAFFALIVFTAYAPAKKIAAYRSDFYQPTQANFQGRPNILWLVTEDISPYLACYGDSTASTPNLDRLAKEGIRYTGVYDVSGVCAPSRSALISGMYPTYLGTNNMRTQMNFPAINIPAYSVVLPPEVKMFSELMRRGGYYCTNNGKEDYQFEGLQAGWDENSRTAHYRNAPAGKPFFAMFNFNTTHESQIWLKKDDPLLVDPRKVVLPPYYPESPVIRRDVTRMYSNIAEMDKQVGMMLEELEVHGGLENTIIIWQSDNGGPLPRGKRELYNTGLKIPLLIRFPHRKGAGAVDDQLISFVDFAPTILSLAGIKIPSYMQGRAFAGGQKGKPRKYIYAARDRMDATYDMVRAVGDGRYKYFKNFQPEKPYIQHITFRLQMDLMKELILLNEKGSLNDVQKLWFRQSKPVEELYDTRIDPFELNNLAARPGYAAIIKEFCNELSSWMTLTADKGFIPERQFIEAMWPGMVQPQTANPLLTMKGKKLAIASATPGASLSWQYVKNGSPVNTKNWQLYTQPVVLLPNHAVLAFAERIGYRKSEIKDFAQNKMISKTR